MRIEARDQFGSQIKRDATQVVIYDDAGNPVLVALKVNDGTIFYAGPRDKGFQKALAILGIEQDLVVDRVRPSRGRIVVPG